jgi:hypothetical protein
MRLVTLSGLRPVLPAVALLAAGGAARAVETPPPEAAVVAQARPAPDPRRMPMLLLGARFGAVVPEAFNKLDANFLVEIELACQLPIPRIENRLGLFLDVGYMRPTQSGTRLDPRVMACNGVPCSESWDEVIHDVGFTLGVHYWHPITNRWLIYGGVGARMHLTRTIINASAGGSAFGQNSEDSTRFGVLLRLGTGVRLGPGALQFEVQLDDTPIDHLITGGERQGESANTASLAFQLGYTLFLL